jgi:hypothetical protein
MDSGVEKPSSLGPMRLCGFCHKPFLKGWSLSCLYSLLLINMDEAQVNLDWDGFDFIESGMQSPKSNLPHFESAQATFGQFLHKGNPDGI